MVDIDFRENKYYARVMISPDAKIKQKTSLIKGYDSDYTFSGMKI